MDVIKILEKLQSDGLVRLNKVSNKYYQIYCPFHNDGNERKPSCGVLLETEVKNGTTYPEGWCHCFTCGYSKTLPNMITDLLSKKGVSKSGLDWLKENVPGFDGSNIEFETLLPKSTMDALHNKYALSYTQKLMHIQPTYVPEEELKKYRYTIQYMYDRKLTDEIIELFDVGFDKDWVPPNRKKPVPCITFPVRDINGNTLFLCTRSVQGKFFNYPTDVTKPVYGLYELPKGCTSVVVCESCFNALTSWVYGRPAVALLGTGNEYQIEQLSRLGVKEFIFAMDPDDAGRRATKKLKRRLSSVAICWEFEGIPEGKDLNDLTKEEFDSLNLV